MKKKFKLEDLDCANCAAKMEEAIKKKLLAIFIGIVCMGIVIVGYLFNIFGYML